jgi:hemolysin III
LSGQRLARELVADGVVHALGLILGVAGAGVLVLLVLFDGDPVVRAPLFIYAAGFLVMLACSAAYNVLRSSPRRDWLRRFDHAAIFAMIAGTYTPFTTLRLTGAWSSGLTAVIWAIAVVGMAAKLFRPRRIETISIVLYLTLGWIGLVALRPFLTSLDATTLALLAGGGVLYSVGVVFHVWESLPYHNAIWHGFVLTGAVVHYAAVVNETMV